VLMQAHDGRVDHLDVSFMSGSRCVHDPAPGTYPTPPNANPLAHMGWCPFQAFGFLTKPKYKQSKKRMKWTMERPPLIWGVSTKLVPNSGTETSAR